MQGSYFYFFYLRASLSVAYTAHKYRDTILQAFASPAVTEASLPTTPKGSSMGTQLPWQTALS